MKLKELPLKNLPQSIILKATITRAEGHLTGPWARYLQQPRWASNPLNYLPAKKSEYRSRNLEYLEAKPCLSPGTSNSLLKNRQLKLELYSFSQLYKLAYSLRVFRTTKKLNQRWPRTSLSTRPARYQSATLTRAVSESTWWSAG